MLSIRLTRDAKTVTIKQLERGPANVSGAVVFRWSGCEGSAVFSRARPCGAVAQLGERLDRTQEVRGSTPLSSTLACNLKSWLRRHEFWLPVSFGRT
jgi:hypothetical protein